ncbi:NPCBM/NEW2 domain-containing protein [Sinomonas gamaensis]|uniref:NPCBM/NEW2 domain-containing protein n=1 Tax=Sinomonas gamaensis TaxID=2565624 RepID=UPI0014866DE8|nr:NPCBM/NEW2 domain-containing protein [Sinomonas gamaensis]
MKTSNRITAAALALLLATGAGINAALADATPAPGSFLYEGCDEQFGVYPAPVKDKDPSGQPITPKPDADGKAMPVILVHGWTGGPNNFEQPANLFGDSFDGGKPLSIATSLTGRLQSIPGVAVYDFDYSQYASRWVTDSNIGPKLASAIECLTGHFGRKAAVVAHSMGGLATRFALAQKDSTGQPISARVASVDTFGTPNTGSDIARALAAVGGASQIGVLTGDDNLATGALAAAWLFLQACGRVYTTGGKIGGPCSAIPPFVGSLDSDGGRALRTGSSELAALPQWPAGMPVHAVDGTINVRGIDFFTLASDPAINIGDGPVTNDSALSGSTSTNNDPCAVQLFGRYGSVQYARDGDVRSGNPLDLFSPGGLPCSHANLMRTLNGVNPVVGSVRAEAGNAASVALPGSAAASSPATASSTSSPTDTAGAGQKWFGLDDEETRAITYDGGQYDMRTATIRTTKYPKSMVYRYQGKLPTDMRQNWVDFALNGKCTSFETGIGISTLASSPTSSATFTVFVDGAQKAQSSIGYYNEPQNLHLNVTGATRLRLQLDFPGYNATLAAWGSPRIYCSENPSPGP